MLGADVAGMSTTAGTIVAHHEGMHVLAPSLVVIPESFELDHEQKASHEEVLELGLQCGNAAHSCSSETLAFLGDKLMHLHRSTLHITVKP
ncbi:purine nucleoside phosphorylase [Echinococcus multilocularis]|uniref:Purine nucleoside phosphorylase n=1 Tax=Echinococcus multilocularis TaxID=6211 RepID=A0A068Y316_ECHMU|nr:purine nucleoside phosphorylase [Echinococcus multilocularis]